jgi:hypothetical protein
MFMVAADLAPTGEAVTSRTATDIKPHNIRSRLRRAFI